MQFIFICIVSHHCLYSKNTCNNIRISKESIMCYKQLTTIIFLLNYIIFIINDVSITKGM